MHQVPSVLSDHSGNPGGKVIISPARPGRDTQDRDTLNDLLPWQPPGSVGCEHGDFEITQRREATCNLINAHLSATDFRKVPWGHHEYAERSLQHLFPSIAESFAGSYITYRDLSASRPSMRA